MCLDVSYPIFRHSNIFYGETYEKVSGTSLQIASLNASGIPTQAKHAQRLAG